MGDFNAYEKDPSSPVGQIDLSTFKDVQETEVAMRHGFQITTLKGNYKLIAMTSFIRQNWMNVISRSCEIMTTSYIEDEIKLNKKASATQEVTTSTRRSRVTSPNNKKDSNHHKDKADQKGDAGS